MRTTLNIDDDLLMAFKEIAAHEKKSVGSVISAVLRRALVDDGRKNSVGPGDEPIAEFGFRPFPKRGGVVTNALINRLREETGT